jgi:hypothetical protein
MHASNPVKERGRTASVHYPRCCSLLHRIPQERNGLISTSALHGSLRNNSIPVAWQLDRKRTGDQRSVCNGRAYAYAMAQTGTLNVAEK